MDNFREEFDQDKPKSTKSDFFKMKEGDNKLRIVSKPTVKEARWGIGICYPGAPYCNPVNLEKEYQQKLEEAKANGTDPKNVSKSTIAKKWLAWAIDRSTGKFVIVDMGVTLTQSIRDLMDSEDYKFDEFPMPYDITVKAKNAGTLAVEYSVVPRVKREPLTIEEQDEFAALTPINQIIERMQANQKAKYESGQVTGSMEPAEPMHQHEALEQNDSVDDDEIKVENIPF